MIFRKCKKNLFFLLGFLFLPHCGLDIGEKTPSIPTYITSLDPGGYCSQLDYKEEFSSYFLKEQKENLVDNSSGQKLSKALNCLISPTKAIKERFSHEQIDKQELMIILNHNVIKTKSTQPIIDHITDPAYFDTYIFIKDALIYLIGEQQADNSIKADKICKAQNGQFVLSKQDVDVFVDFLEDLSEFFLKMEQISYEVFDGFFKSKNILLKSQMEDDNIKKDFISFLSKYLFKDFPGYSSFLDEHLKLETQREQNRERDLRPSLIFPNTLPTRQERLEIEQKNLEIQIWNKILQSPFDMIWLPPSSSDTLTVQNIKYIMLNIYIVKTLFSVYDNNQNFKLDPQELESWLCLITPIISIISAQKGEEQEEQPEFLRDPKTIVSYIINQQDIPPEDISISQFFDIVHYVWYAATSSKDLKTLYYSDVSRLISVLLLQFFDKEEDVP